MSFTFQTIKTSLINSNSTIGIFDFRLNSKSYTLLFSFINIKDKAELFFTKVGTQDTLALPVDRNYTIDTYFKNNKYREIKKFFDIPFNGNAPFRPIELFKAIDKNLSFRALNTSTDHQTRSTIYRTQNPDAIYYHYMINWDITDPTKHYSQFNRQKVQILIPTLYTSLMGKNVSVFFTDTPLDATAENNAIQLDLNQL